MKFFSLILTFFLLSNTLFAQNSDAPAMSQLAKMKAYCESHFKIWFSIKSLYYDSVRSASQTKELTYQQKVDSLSEAQEFIQKYNLLKITIDELIVQLKADMTLANSRKRLKQLNAGTHNPESWYGKKFSVIKNLYTDFVMEFEANFNAGEVEAITGIFSAVTGFITSARDHRLEKVKLLNEQLESLRLKPYYELLEGKGSKD